MKFQIVWGDAGLAGARPSGEAPHTAEAFNTTERDRHFIYNRNPIHPWTLPDPEPILTMKVKAFSEFIVPAFAVLLCVAHQMDVSSRAATVEACTEEALHAAASAGGAVTFACDGTIVLSNTVSVRTNLVIDGTGRNITISGGNSVRIFDVGPNVTFVLRNLTIADGLALGTDASVELTPEGDVKRTLAETVYGGAIRATNARSIRIESCVFSHNTVRGGAPVVWNHLFPGDSFGGAIFMSGGTLIVSNSRFDDNTAVQVSAGGFEDNVAGLAAGGAIYGEGIDLHLIDSSFANNSAGSPGGGALIVTNGTVQVQGCEFEGNRVMGRLHYRFSQHTGPSHALGGAIALIRSDGTVTNSNFRSNSALSVGNYLGAGGYARGGAIYADSTLHIDKSVFAQNVLGAEGTPAVGGAVYVGGPATVGSSRFVENTAYDVTASLAGGGALYAASNITAVNSSFVSNTASGGYISRITPYINDEGPAMGGAIYAEGAISATNLTVALNSVKGHDENLLTGGGCYFEAPDNFIAYSTFATNQFFQNFRYTGSPIVVSGIPGAAIATGTNGSVKLHSTILAGASSNLVSGTLIDLGFNLSSDSSFSHPSSANHIDHLLGGMTQSTNGIDIVMLRLGSPAIDAADPANFPSMDARGVTRPAGSKPDIGAFEFRGDVDVPVEISVAREPAQTIGFSISDGASRTFVLESTELFDQWTPVATNSTGSGTFDFEIPISATSRFFRIRTIP